MYLLLEGPFPSRKVITEIASPRTSHSFLFRTFLEKIVHLVNDRHMHPSRTKTGGGDGAHKGISQKVYLVLR